MSGPPATTDTDAELRGTAWWLGPEGPPGFPRAPTFPHRLALVGSEALIEAIEPDCAVHPLTRTSWRALVSPGRFDALVVEPCLHEATGTWGRALLDGDRPDDDLAALVARARRVGLPVMGWMSGDAAYWDLQRGFGALLDAAFCADPEVARRLEADGVAAEVVGPVVQPSLMNPFLRLEDGRVRGAPWALSEDWPSAVNVPALRPGLEALVPLGLGITATEALVHRRKVADAGPLGSAMLGAVTARGRLALLKRAGVLIQSAEALATPARAARAALEAAACRTVVLHHGALPEDDPRRAFARAFDDWDALRAHAEHLCAAPLAWMREAQRAWRHAHAERPIDAALARLLTVATGAAVAPPSRRASVIVPSYRPERLPAVLAGFRAQTWPDRELIVVANTDEPGAWDEGALDPARERLVRLPRERWAGTALNLGSGRATGDHCLRMDDDDLYGPHYVRDVMLHARATGADVLGKQGAFVRFAADGTTHMRARKLRPPTVFPASAFDYRRGLTIAGFTVTVSRALMAERGYPDRAFGFADTALFARERGRDATIALCDPLNAVFERRVDLGSHTWQLAMGRDDHGAVPVGGDHTEAFA